jgi:hypothetical protein
MIGRSGDRPNRSLDADRASITSVNSADMSQHLRSLLGGDVVDEHAHGRFTASQLLELARCPTDREDLQEQVGQVDGALPLPKGFGTSSWQTVRLPRAASRLKVAERVISG